MTDRIANTDTMVAAAGDAAGDTAASEAANIIVAKTVAQLAVTAIAEVADDCMIICLQITLHLIDSITK